MRRMPIQKIAKGFSEKEGLLVASEINVKALEAHLEATRPKKRKKVEVSPNSRFADIRAIQRAQIATGWEEIEIVDSSDSSD